MATAGTAAMRHALAFFFALFPKLAVNVGVWLMPSLLAPVTALCTKPGIVVDVIAGGNTEAPVSNLLLLKLKSWLRRKEKSLVPVLRITPC